MSESYLSTLMSQKGSRPTIDPLLGIAHATGFTIAWLATGEGPKRSIENEPWRAMLDELDDPAPALLGHMTFLPRYDVQASAGSGAVVHSEQIVDFVAFNTTWLRQTIGVDPKRAGVITAVGDSMYPTIADGDILIIDLSIDRVLDNAIYALRFGDALSVKRVQLRPTGGLRIISDNAKYAPDELGADSIRDLHVVGRIIWHGGVM
jgi:phage repressor protein C with HTH and peptisase S24 domain